MTLTDHDPHIPDDLAHALRRAAAGVPDADLHSTTPVLRLRTRRQRRRTLAASGIAAALLASVVLANQFLIGGSDVVTGDPAQAPSDDPEDGITSSESQPWEDGALDQPVQLGNLWVELQPDGSVVSLPHAEPGDVPEDGLRLADGRIVTLATRDMQPVVEREDGPNVESLAVVLAVFDADGQLLRERDVRGPGGHARLAGEHDGQVVLVRMLPTNDGAVEQVADISAVDLDTFEETGITAAELPAQNLRMHIAGGRLVALGESMAPDDPLAGCTVAAVDLTSGQSWVVVAPPCWVAGNLAVSPDGRYVAITTENMTGGGEGTVSLEQAVIDLASNDMPVVQTLGTEPAACEMSGSCTLPTPVAVTWTSPDEVTVVLAPDGAVTQGEVHPEQLETITVTVP